MTNFTRAHLPSVTRRLVRPHAPSGRDALVIPSHVERVDGYDYADGRALIESLVAIAAAPERVYRHRWKVGDLLMWDNRCMMHRGTPFPQFDQVRELRSCRVRDVDDEG
jgi:alpha-ketoglutarate-dependent taurine dioxygenase